MSKNQISVNYRLIESITSLPILQISSSGNKKNAPADLAAKAFRYHNCWAGLKTGDLLEIYEYQGLIKKAEPKWPCLNSKHLF